MHKKNHWTGCLTMQTYLWFLCCIQSLNDKHSWKWYFYPSIILKRWCEMFEFCATYPSTIYSHIIYHDADILFRIFIKRNIFGLLSWLLPKCCKINHPHHSNVTTDDVLFAFSITAMVILSVIFFLRANNIFCCARQFHEV